MSREKLVPMNEYVKELTHNKDLRFETYDKLIKIVFYRILLSSQPQLGDYVPCKDGVPLEKPPRYDELQKAIDSKQEISYSAPEFSKCGEYARALDSVLFEGWEAKWRKKIYAMQEPLLDHPKDGYVMLLLHKDSRYTWEQMKLYKTIEDLITSGIELAPTEALNKQLGI